MGTADLQLLFKKTAEKFIKPLSFYNKAFRIRPKEEPVEEEAEAEEETEQPSAVPVQPVRAKPSGEVDLLDLQVTDQPDVPAATPDHPVAESFSLERLEEHFDFDDDKFQELWAELPHE